MGDYMAPSGGGSVPVARDSPAQWTAQIDPEEADFFFGKVSRAVSERWLDAPSVKPGVFLIRMSSVDAKSFTLSLRCQREVVHFQVVNHGESWYSVDNGPMFVGLEDLVQHYRAVADGLPIMLRESYPKNVVKTRQADPTRGNTPLHAAGAKGDAASIKRLATSPAAVSARNAWGRTVLHEAVRTGSEEAVKALLAIRPGRDLIPLTDKQGYTPAHIAARIGNDEIMRALLCAGSDPHIQSTDGETAQGIAARLGHVQCSILLGMAELGFKSKKEFDTRDFPWYHGRLTRSSAEFVLARHGKSDGLFLVRQSTNSAAGVQSQMDCVLSMSYEGTPYHYQIKADSATLKYNIDDGPAFTGLNSVVAYYSEQPDGLARSLKNYCLLGGPAGAQADGSLLKNAESLVGLEEGHINIIRGDQIVEGATIGSGNFGDVKVGTWNKPGSPPIPVALKTVRDVNQSPSATQEFLIEATDMVQLQNPYIVQLLGICTHKGVCIVLELVPHGALEDSLRGNKRFADWVKDGMPYLFGAQICIAMDFLESKRVVHRDLATRNVLLKTKYHCKISDFGLSRTLRADENYYTSTTGGKWPIKWYAPESVNYGKFTAKSDVFSFGVTMWEIYSQAREPWGDLSMSEVLERLNRGDRLECPKGCPQETYGILMECWNMDKARRPDFKTLIDIWSKQIPQPLRKHMV
eukprot:m.444967 g.444967  ORF g.444967 m.444967 type:complete len:692 (+) comp19172_c0_seq1:125-2200(+)